MRHCLCSVMCTDWFICALRSRTLGVGAVRLSRVKLPTVFFSLARAIPIIIVIIYSPQFFEMRNKHIYTLARIRTHSPTTRAINMKYCLIEDIVLKTLPRAFFPRFFFIIIIIIRYLFIIFRPPLGLSEAL